MEHLGNRRHLVELNMPIDYVSKLIEFAGPIHPVEQPKVEDWERVERELGLQLPTDYKSLVTALGSGEFGVGLNLKNPVSSSECSVLSVDALEKYRNSLLFLESRKGIRLFPEPLGLVVIGGIDRQDFLFRPRHRGAEPSHLFNLDHEYELVRDVGKSLSHFLHDLYLGVVHDERLKRLRTGVWLDEKTPFFKCRPGRHATDSR
jgi:hypothetical protein